MVIENNNSTTTAHSTIGSNRAVPKNPNNIFANSGKYITDEAFQEANTNNYKSMGLVADEFNKHGTKSLENINYDSMDEWTQFKVAQNNSYVTNFWIDNLSKGLNGRELITMTDRASTGKNYYKDGLKQINKYISPETKRQTITKRDEDGNPTDQAISIDEILRDDSLLEKYINDPAIKSAIISGGKALKASNELNDAIRYDKRDVNALNKIGAALHLGGTAGAVTTGAVGIGSFVIAAKTAAAAAGGATLTGMAAWSGMASIGAFLFSPIGIGLLVGLAVVAVAVTLPYVINAFSEGSQYIQDGRNDNPSGTWFSGKDFACSWSWLTGANAKEN
jgi:hypothetical protein